MLILTVTPMGAKKSPMKLCYYVFTKTKTGGIMEHIQTTREKPKGTHFTWEEGLILLRALYISRISSSKELAVLPGKSKKTYSGR